MREDPNNHSLSLLNYVKISKHYGSVFSGYKSTVYTGIGVARIFGWGGPNHKSHAMTSSETPKEEFFVGQRYHGIEDQKPWPGVGT